jgi:hypothetical protein
MEIDDKVSRLSLSDLAVRSDAEIVRIWLTERGFVAVAREIMNENANLPGVVYHAEGDYYFRKPSDE